MSAEEYLKGIVKEQTLSDDSKEIEKLRKHRKNVEVLLKNEFGDDKPTIQYGGSYKKNTMIKEHFDLDLISYFNHDCTSAGESLKDIYDNVASSLEKKYNIDRKKSAIRILGKDDDHMVDFHIDVVPGRYVDDKKDDVFINQYGVDKERLKTNLNKHISHIRDSGLTHAIRLLKLWNVRQYLGVKTFILELMAVKVLKSSKGKSLDKQLLEFWNELVEKDGNIAIEDPANPSGNDLGEFNDSSKQLILASSAKSTLSLIEASGWEQVYGQLVDNNNSAVYASIVKSSSERTKPWANIN
ncbi:MAG: hypothetical protein GY834_17125 [Bacteroidetes bacterium]|nr:hypothetical protein [Bacteroidota bacterium]